MVICAVDSGCTGMLSHATAVLSCAGPACCCALRTVFPQAEAARYSLVAGKAVRASLQGSPLRGGHSGHFEEAADVVPGEVHVEEVKGLLGEIARLKDKVAALERQAASKGPSNAGSSPSGATSGGGGGGRSQPGSAGASPSKDSKSPPVSGEKPVHKRVTRAAASKAKKGINLSDGGGAAPPQAAGAEATEQAAGSPGSSENSKGAAASVQSHSLTIDQ